MLDFEDRLADYLDSLSVGYVLYYDSHDSTDSNSSIAVVSAPGSRTLATYYDGTKEKGLTTLCKLMTEIKTERRRWTH